MKRNEIKQPKLYTEVVTLDGGLNENVSSIEMKAGELIYCKNYYLTEGSTGGYVSIAGYERYDGQPSPSGVAATSTNDAAREAARALITEVPGQGAILGVWVYKGNVYAFRNKAGGLTAGMFVESGTGWDEVDLGSVITFTSGNGVPVVGQTITGVTSGATATIRKITKTSGDWGANTAAGTIVVTGITNGPFTAAGEEVTSATTQFTIGAGAVVARTIAPGGRYSFINYNFSGSSFTETMYWVNGVDKAGYFDGTTFDQITTGMTIDTPNHIAVHGDRLFLAFTGASLQYSTVGDPTDWSTSAGEIGVGYEITALAGSVGETLIVFGESNIKILEGNDTSTWTFKTYSDVVGAYPYTVTKLFDTLIFMSDMGVTTLSAAQEFGDFASNSISEKVKKTLFKYKSLITGATAVRSLNQYRLFFSNGKGLVFSFFNKKLRGITIIEYPNPVLIATDGRDSTGEPINFFSSSAGYVYHMDIGSSFDGATISYRLSTSYFHYKSPRYWKRFLRLTFEIFSIDDITFKIRPAFDYSMAGYPKGIERDLSALGAGDLWGEGEWGEMVWAGTDVTNRVFYDLMGLGSNMSLTITHSSKYTRQHTFQNFITDYIFAGRQL